MKTGSRVACVIIGCALLIAGLMPAAFGQVDHAVGDCDDNVHVRAEVRMKNNTGQTANDLHFRYYQNDRAGINVEGGTIAGGEPFNNVTTTMNNNGQTVDGQPDPNNHAIDVDMSGGDVPDGDWVNLELILCLNKKNCLKIKDAYWTKDGVNIGKARVNKGWRMKRPVPGGDGGNQEPGGGGRGAQEDDGGAGPYIHRVIIENDDTVPFRVKGMKLLASMTYYDNLENDVDWDAIDSLDIIPEGGIEIPPGNTWAYDFNTTGAYLNGHIYMMYSTGPGGVLPPGLAASAMVDEDDTEYGDHPPDSICTTCVPGNIPTLTEWGMIIMFVIMAAGIVWFVVRLRKGVATA